MKIKRLISFVLAFCLLLGTVPGLAVSAQAAEKMTLKVWVDGYSIEWAKERCADFQKAHPEWKITFQYQSYAPGSAYYMITPNPKAAGDVFVMSNDEIGSLVQNGALLAFTGSDATEIRKNNSKTMVDSVTYTDGKLYGVPYGSNTWIMYYNKKIFNENDVKSMEAMLAKGKVAFELTNTWYISSFYFANGGKMFGDQGMEGIYGVDFATDAGVAVTEYLVDLLNEPNLMWESDGRGREGLKDGTVGAYFSGSWDYSGLYAALGDDLGATCAPTVQIDGKTRQMKSFCGSKAFGVNAHTKYPEAAKELALFLANKESQKDRFTMTKTTPVHVDLQNDKAVNSSIVAQAEIKAIHKSTTVQPSIAEMNNYWTYMSSFANGLVNGSVTRENARESTVAVTKSMNGGAAITKHPADAEAEVGEKVKFTVRAEGEGLTYQWQYRTSAKGTWKTATTVGNKTKTLTVAAKESRNGYQYRCVVQSADGGKVACDPATLDLPGLVTIEAPDGVTASRSNSSGKVTVKWNKVAEAAKYKVEYSTNKKTWKSLKSGTTSTKVTHSNAKLGTTYYYRVTAIAADGTASEPSKVVSSYRRLAQPVVTLSNVASTGKIRISWEKVEGAVKYEVYRATSKNGTYKRLTTVTGTSVINRKTTAGTTYYYKVRALCDDADAKSVFSEIKSRTCDLERPDVTVTKSSGKPYLKWDKVDGAVKYQVYRATSKNGTYQSIKITTSRSFKDTSAKSGKTYYYKVKAICKNTSGNSAYSSIDSMKATR